MFESFTQSWDECLTPEGIPTLQCAFIAFNNVINGAIVLSGVVAVFFIIWAGFKFVTSQGNMEQVASARQTFFYALIGLIFVILAYSIFNFVLDDLFGIESPGQFIEE